MKKSDIITSVTSGLLAILTIVIGLNVIPLDAIGYAERSIDVAFILVLFIFFSAISVGILVGNAIVRD
jgi:hypothetical protein